MTSLAPPAAQSFERDRFLQIATDQLKIMHFICYMTFGLIFNFFFFIIVKYTQHQIYDRRHFPVPGSAASDAFVMPDSAHRRASPELFILKNRAH